MSVRKDLRDKRQSAGVTADESREHISAKFLVLQSQCHSGRIWGWNAVLAIHQNVHIMMFCIDKLFKNLSVLFESSGGI